jgi:hypothetical protein
MAMASTLMMERKGRCSRLARTSLFIREPNSAGRPDGVTLAFKGNSRASE